MTHDLDPSVTQILPASFLSVNIGHNNDKHITLGLVYFARRFVAYTLSGGLMENANRYLLFLRTT